MNRRDAQLALATLPLAGPCLDASGLHVFGALPAPERARWVFAAGAPTAVLVYVPAPDKPLG